MELRQLEYFVAVAEEANFTRGAERVHVAQPGVSAQIRRLERELGHPLFDRSARTVRLTDIGAVVLPYARAALAAAAGARFAVDEMAGLVRGRVSIGMVTACAAPTIFDLLAEFRAAHPAVEMALTEANSDELVRRLRAGSLDLALVGVTGPPLADLITHVLADEAVVAAVRRDNPLATRDRITLAALQGLDLIALPVGTGLRTCVDEACAASGVQLRISFEASDPRVIAELAARGLGVALLPESLGSMHDLRPIPIVRPTPRSRLELAWRSPATASPAARALIESAKKQTPAATQRTR